MTLSEHPCGELQLDVAIWNLRGVPNDIRSLAEGSLIVEETCQIRAGFPIGWMALQSLAKILLVGFYGIVHMVGCWVGWKNRLIRRTGVPMVSNGRRI